MSDKDLRNVLQDLLECGSVELLDGVEGFGERHEDEPAHDYVERHAKTVTAGGHTLSFGQTAADFVMVADPEMALGSVAHDDFLAPACQLDSDGYIDGLYISTAGEGRVFRMENHYSSGSMRADIRLVARSLVDFLTRDRSTEGARTTCRSFADLGLPGEGWVLDGRGLPCPVDYGTERAPLMSDEQSFAYAGDLLFDGDVETEVLLALPVQGAQPKPPRRDTPTPAPEPAFDPSSLPVQDVEIDYVPGGDKPNLLLYGLAGMASAALGIYLALSG